MPTSPKWLERLPVDRLAVGCNQVIPAVNLLADDEFLDRYTDYKAMGDSVHSHRSEVLGQTGLLAVESFMKNGGPVNPESISREAAALVVEEAVELSEKMKRFITYNGLKQYYHTIRGCFNLDSDFVNVPDADRALPNLIVDAIMPQSPQVYVPASLEQRFRHKQQS